jgi:NADH dehydrogenase (ubiquinone) Fe-S protein 6
MSLSLFRYGSRRCLSALKTPAASTTVTKFSDEKYVKVYDKLEDLDQKRVTVPVNRDLYPSDTMTHTGQVYDRNDYRNVRFLNKSKLVCSRHLFIVLSTIEYRLISFQVNPRFAIDYIRDDPVVVCRTRGVWSDSGGPLGHPKVYINLVRYPYIIRICSMSFFSCFRHH